MVNKTDYGVVVVKKMKSYFKMKKLLILFLLIPSLSWGKEVALNCERAEEALSGINETFVFDLNKKTVENVLSDGSLKSSSILNVTDSLIQFEALGYTTQGKGGLNRYTLELIISDRVDNEGRKIKQKIYYQCEIIKKQL
jgi:hypothetical protein